MKSTNEEVQKALSFIFGNVFVTVITILYQENLV